MSNPRRVRILFLGDVFGEPGRRAVKHFVPELRKKHALDLVFANVENAANGRGIAKRQIPELRDAGVDFMTSGNHIYQVQDSYEALSAADSKILRPDNFPRSSPGRGVGVATSSSGIRVGLINLMGRVFMEPGVDLPFDAADRALMALKGEADVIVMDFHAEATAEKRALAWHLDGRIQLFVGTHTHVPTADEEILPGGMAYITDLGMCGPYDSVIGMKKETAIRRMKTLMPAQFEVADGNDIRLCGVICEIDVDQKRAVSIQRLCERLR